MEVTPELEMVPAVLVRPVPRESLEASEGASVTLYRKDRAVVTELAPMVSPLKVGEEVVAMDCGRESVTAPLEGSEAVI